MQTLGTRLHPAKRRAGELVGYIDSTCERVPSRGAGGGWCAFNPSVLQSWLIMQVFRPTLEVLLVAFST